MAFNLFKAPSWGVFNCVSGDFHPADKMPFEIGSDEGVDLKLTGHGVRPKHCAITQIRGGGVVLTPVDSGFGEVVVNGNQIAQPLALVLEQDYAVRIGPHLLAVRGGRALDAWRSRLDSGRWMISHQPSGATLGPVPFAGLFTLAQEQGLDPDEVACCPWGMSTGFWLGQLRQFYSDRIAPASANGNSAGRSTGFPDAGEDPTPRLATDKGDLTCPVCWLKFDIGDVMHIAVHDSLLGDPVLGEDVQQRFHATKFNDRGQALDALGLPCTDLACPHCRTKFPPGFIDAPHHIFSLVGNASAGKSYYLSVLAKVLPGSLFTNLNLVWQDADPGGNAPLNAMKNRLFGASDAEEAALEKTVLGGAMYLQAPRYGKSVQMPRPFVFNVSPKDRRAENLSIIFYDNAGEHFRPDIKIEDSPGALHVASASGIFFLFDPTRNYEFRKRLVGHEDPQLTMGMNDLQDVMLSEMKTRIMRLQRLDIGHRIKTPLAVMVGKFDAWYHLLGDEPVYECLDRHGDGLKLDSIRHNSEITRALMMKICPTIVANAEALSENVCYFPVSAFGHTPLRTTQGGIAPDPARLAPILLEVPTLWVLHQIAPDLIKVAKPTLPEAAPAGETRR
jgi:hypothetical protein